MKAVVKLAPGEGNIEVQDVPIPQIKPDEVLVAVKGTGLCGTDSLLYQWTYRGRAPVPTPIVLGHEAAGEIAEVGAQVKNVKVGDRVALDALIGCGKCYYCRHGLIFLCRDWDHLGISFDGTFAEYVAIPACAVRTLPDDVSWEDAAFLEILAVVAHTMERIKICGGDNVVIIGPGPLGLFHLQAVRAAGAGQTIVVGTDGDDARLAVATKVGADHVLDESKVDAVEAILDLTGGVGADVVIEAGGTPSAVATAFEVVRGGAQMAFLGFAKQAEFVPLNAVRNSLNVQFVLSGLGRHVEQSIRWIQAGQVLGSRIITHRIPLDEADYGFQEMLERRAVKVYFNMEEK